MAINSAEANIKQAKEWNAGGFTESQAILQNAIATQESARIDADRQQYATALTLGQEAKRLSDEAKKAALARYADQQLQEARKAVQIARINDGPNQNAKLFEDSQKQLQQTEDKYGKQKYEKTIELAKATSETVNQLLASLKNAAENQIPILRGKLADLEKYDAKALYPSALSKTMEEIAQIETKIRVDRDYKQAIILAGTANSEAENAITETKKRLCDRFKDAFNEKITRAESEDAAAFNPSELKTCKESFEELKSNIDKKQYDTALSSAGMLKLQIDRMLLNTLKEGTRDKIRKADNGTRDLKEQDVETFLPGRIKAADDALAQAQEAFQKAESETSQTYTMYDEPLNKAKNALAEYDKVVGAFSGIAENEIRIADQKVSEAKETFDKMGTFFGTPQQPKPVDERIDAQRQTDMANLNARLSGAQQTTKTASESRKATRFKKAIELSGEAGTVAADITNNCYRITAQYTLIAVQDELSNLERQQADSIAPEQVKQVKALFDETQQLIRQNQNENAVKSAAQAKAYLESVKQEMARQAIKEKGKADEMLQRLEGGPAPRPATGGRPLSLNASDEPREYPGGSGLNNKQIAQSGTVTGNVVSGMPAPGASSGAIVGTQPEPVVPAREGAGKSQSAGAYEPPTGPGPFMATGGGSGMKIDTPGPESPSSIGEQVDAILNDNQRVRDILRFQPGAIDRARAKLRESGEALKEQNYARAMTAAKEAQRIIIEAEQRAAKSAAKENLQKAADRINVSESAGSIMFAPAQLTEAINLYEQAEKSLAAGDYIAARDASSHAVTAADDARLYNVKKARDLAALSTTYGGWTASHPLVVQAEQSASVAESMLSRPDTAPCGQELAKQAVTAAQLALDHARDYSYQERIDNIYKALNTALQAGANYFNVTEVKTLIAEISAVRDEYCTRNYDAVELKLKDIEARLARVIETTPLVLEQNLVENTSKLNALIQAGAENYMAQEVDDVKTLMNRSVIDFRKKDFASSYTNLKNALSLTDKIEERLQEQVYFDAVIELFAQMDKAMKDFNPLLNHDRYFLKQLVRQPNGQNSAINLSGRFNPNDFKDAITDIYLRAIHLKPPKPQLSTHEQVLVTIKSARAAAENFQKLYLIDQVSQRDADEIIDTAYNQIEQAKKMRGALQVNMIDPMARTKVIKADKIVNY
ncbi:MAG: hypothetical protein WCK47_06160 [bacterium]